MEIVIERLALLQKEGGLGTAWDTMGAAMSYLSFSGDARGAAQWAARAAACASLALGRSSVEFERYNSGLVGLEREWLDAGARLTRHGYAVLDGFAGVRRSALWIESPSHAHGAALARTLILTDCPIIPSARHRFSRSPVGLTIMVSGRRRVRVACATSWERCMRMRRVASLPTVESAAGEMGSQRTCDARRAFVATSSLHSR